MPLGTGCTVEGQLTGEEIQGGLELSVFDAKPGRVPDRPPREDAMMWCCSSPAMGLGAGGRMRQKVYPDPHGLRAWDQTDFARLPVHIVNSEMFTGGQRPGVQIKTLNAEQQKQQDPAQPVAGEEIAQHPAERQSAAGRPEQQEECSCCQSQAAPRLGKGRLRYRAVIDYVSSDGSFDCNVRPHRGST